MSLYVILRSGPLRESLRRRSLSQQPSAPPGLRLRYARKDPTTGTRRTTPPAAAKGWRLGAFDTTSLHIPSRHQPL